jgi:GNAT superfamily N-acetyltransferase
MQPVKVANPQIRAELDDWDREYELDVTTAGGCRLTLADDGFSIHIEHISVPHRARRSGLGTAMMLAVCAWADEHGETLRLHASEEYGTDRATLSRFYGRHGFVSANRIGGMVRHPNEN